MGLNLDDIAIYVLQSTIATHLDNLRRLEQSVEDHLAIAVDLDERAVYDETLADIAPEEGGLAIADGIVAKLREHTYPRLFRGGFLVTLFATFEDCVRLCGDVAREFADDTLPSFKETSNRLKKEARGKGQQDGGLIQAIELHFFTALGYERWDSQLSDDLNNLRRVRNAFAHGAGMPSVDAREKIENWNVQAKTLGFDDDGYIVPSLAFVREARENVDRAVRQLLAPSLAELQRRANGGG